MRGTKKKLVSKNAHKLHPIPLKPKKSKRNTLTKASTRKMSRTQPTKKKVVKGQSRIREQKLLVSSQHLLAEHLKLQTYNYEEVLREARSKKIGQAYVRSSHAKYHAAIGLALALYYAWQKEPNRQERLDELCSEIGYNKSTRTPPTLVIVNAVIDYGETEDGESSKRGFASRDSKAVLHLANRRIDPNDVVTLGKKPGEGLEAWGRKTPRSSPKVKNPKESIDSDWDESNEFPNTKKKPLKSRDDWDDDQEQEDYQDHETLDLEEDKNPCPVTQSGNADFSLKVIETIARAGHVIFRSGKERWAVVPINLGEHTSSTDEELLKPLAKALHAYANKIVA